jgi:hypothetical protein
MLRMHIQMQQPVLSVLLCSAILHICAVGQYFMCCIAAAIVLLLSG